MMSAFKALSKTVLIEIVREPMVLFLTVLFPLMFVLMFTFLPDLPTGGGATTSALAFGLPAVFIFAVLQLGLSGTASPLAQQRASGYLRSLAMTSLSQAMLLTAQIPGRLILVAIDLGLVVVIAAALGAFDPTSWALLLLAVVLCAAVSISLGLAIGASTSNAGLVGGVAGLLAPVLMFGTGLFLPLAMLPEWVAFVARGIPYTYIGDMLRASMAGVDQVYSVGVGTLVCLAWTVVASAIAIRFFRWE